MRSTRLGLLGSVVMAVLVVAGCTHSAGDSTKSGSRNAPATAQPSASKGASAMRADTKAVCTTASGDIEAWMAKVAEAEKIGPPAGHSAVSAQYSAGAATLYTHTFTADTKVNDAVKQVATAMSDLADKYATAPKVAPDKGSLVSAINQFKTVCGLN